MQTFIAIAVPEEIRKKLAAAMARLAPHAEGVTWVAKDHFHITIAFLGEIAPAFIQHASEAVQKICDQTPCFSCAIEGYGYWGNKRNPTAIWASVSLPPELETLQEKIAKALKKYGIQVDSENFRPHIPLGRCLVATANRDLLETMDGDQEADFGEFVVNKLGLYQEKHQAKATVCRTLMKFPLVAESPFS